MSDQVVAELAVGEVPDLYETVPPSGNNQWNRNRWAKAHTRDPFRVALAITGNGVLALTKSVPQSNGRVTRS